MKAQTIGSRFAVHDRVVRPKDVFKASPLWRGEVKRRYSETTECGCYYPELYSVEWDDAPGKIQNGFLPHGLEPENHGRW